MINKTIGGFFIAVAKVGIHPDNIKTYHSGDYVVSYKVLSNNEDKLKALRTNLNLSDVTNVIFKEGNDYTLSIVCSATSAEFSDKEIADMYKAIALCVDGLFRKDKHRCT